MHRFWQNYPAFLYGCGTLLGCFLALGSSPIILLLPFILLFYPLVILKTDSSLRFRLLLALLFVAISFTYCKVHYQFPQLSQKQEGTAHLHINSVRDKSSYSGRGWLYQATLYSFHPKESTTSIATNLPISFYLKQHAKQKRPPAHCDYQVAALLSQGSSGGYYLHVDKNSPWHPIPDSWSTAERRYQAKQLLSKEIHRHIHNGFCASFLVGLATGDFNDKLLAFEFGRFGLQHIMAISGFHFSIVAGILSMFLRMLLPRRAGLSLLLLLLTGYFLFLGPGPAVLRAWIAITIGLMGQLLSRQAMPLNSLGVGLIVVLGMDPTLCTHIGFQFSFLATAAILLLYSPTEQALQFLFPKRRLSQMVRMNGWNRHAYVLLAFFREALALSLAVHLVTVPIVLFYFQKFPLLSLVYNLFFPFLVSISMLLLLMSLLTGLLVPAIGHFLHGINESYTNVVLEFVFQTPTSLDYYWRSNTLSPLLMSCYVCVVLCLAVIIAAHHKERTGDQQDFAIL